MLPRLRLVAHAVYDSFTHVAAFPEYHDEAYRGTMYLLGEQQADGSWLLIRFSGTEALLRIYVEARTPEDVDALLAEGRRIAVPSTAAPAAASAAAG